jgi:ubiquinone/menaquinone biosynthesis C-methylase UbiE
MDRSAGFWNILAKRYSRQAIADAAAYQQKLAKTQAYFEPDMAVLEIGCGTGGTAIIHAPHVKHIRAVDFSKNMIAIAKQRAAEAGVTNVDFAVQGIDAMDAETDAYDAVLALNVLHLVDDREDTIAKIRAMLKPGGVFVSSTATLGQLSRVLQPLLKLLSALRILPLMRLFSADEFIASVTAAGFTVEHEWRPDNSPSVFLIATKAG